MTRSLIRAACPAALALALTAVLVAAPVGTPARYVTSAASALADQGLAAPAPTGAEAAEFRDVSQPGVRFIANVARATNVPWIDSNGWRYQRGVKKANYTKLAAGSAALAAAEAFTYNVDAIFNPDPADVQDLGRMMQFLKGIEAPALPPLANIGVVDDGSPQLSEILNLLTRRNLLYRVVKTPDRSLGVTVQLGSADFPRDAAKNPYEFAARVRDKVGDDNRLVRLYGTQTTIAHLTGDGKRARLHLLSFSAPRGGGRRQQQEGQAAPQQPTPANQQFIRVRLNGRYQPSRFAGFGSHQAAALTDLRHHGNSTEFWVPEFTTFAVIDLNAVAAESRSAGVLESAYAPRELELEANPNNEAWRKAPRVIADHDKSGEPLAGRPTEIRSRWTNENLYLLYICPFDELNLKPDPNTEAETPRLWNWDVAEAFIGSDFENIARYKELQVSPQGEWVDLEIDRTNPKGLGMKWNSGYAVKAHVDQQAKVWYGLMRIPFKALDSRPPQKGRELRAGLYRIAGVAPAKKYYAWRPTRSVTFHVPDAFGIIRLN